MVGLAGCNMLNPPNPRRVGAHKRGGQRSKSTWKTGRKKERGHGGDRNVEAAQPCEACRRYREPLDTRNSSVARLWWRQLFGQTPEFRALEAHNGYRNQVLRQAHYTW